MNHFHVCQSPPLSNHIASDVKEYIAQAKHTGVEVMHN